jgi:hypothetical protein
MVDKTIVAAVKENIFLPHQSEQSGMMCGGLGFWLKSNAFNKLFALGYDENSNYLYVKSGSR